MTVASQASEFVGFSGHEYWSGLPLPSPGNLPDPGNEPRSPALQADSLLPETREAYRETLKCAFGTIFCLPECKVCIVMINYYLELI